MLISPSVTNIRHSCERSSRESDTGSPCSVTAGVSTQPSCGSYLVAMPAALPAAGGQRGTACETHAGPGVPLLSSPDAVYILTFGVQPSQNARLRTRPALPAWAQPWGRRWDWVLGRLRRGWFVAAGLGSPILAQLVTVALLPMFHVTSQHLPKQRENWCISLLPREWLHPGCNEPCQPLAHAGPVFPPPVSEIVCTGAEHCPGI